MRTAWNKRTQEEGLKWMNDICLGRGMCLSTVYLGAAIYHEFECKCGKKCSRSWNACPSSIDQGSWCPRCANQESKQEKELYEILLINFSQLLRGKRRLLKNKMLQLDIYDPVSKRAIEFDGEYWHSRPEAIERDLRKNQECVEAGIQLLRVTDLEWEQNKQTVIEKCLKWLTP